MTLFKMGQFANKQGEEYCLFSTTSAPVLHLPWGELAVLEWGAVPCHILCELQGTQPDCCDVLRVC